jgi:hypothetical protein
MNAENAGSKKRLPCSISQIRNVIDEKGIKSCGTAKRGLKKILDNEKGSHAGQRRCLFSASQLNRQKKEADPPVRYHLSQSRSSPPMRSPPVSGGEDNGDKTFIIRFNIP